MSQPNSISEDGSGFLVGVQPAQPQQASEVVTQQRPDQAVSQPVPQQPPPQQQQSRVFTEEDVEKARQQEKDKLYGRIEELSTGLKSMQEERLAEQAERQRLAEEAEAARRAKEEGEMEVRDLLSKREQEWESRWADLEARAAADKAVYEQERRFMEVQTYRRDRIEQEEQFILPELREFIGGSSPEEVDAAIEEMKARTEQIVSNVVQHYAPQQQPFQGRPTVMPSVPPVGPMEQQPDYQQLTERDIAGMDMKTYAQNRDALLRAASQQRRGQPQ